MWVRCAMTKVAGFLLATLPALAFADASFTVTTDAPPVKAGQKGTAKVDVTPGAGFHLNKDYPTSLVLKELPEGVTIDRLKQSAKDAAKLGEREAEFQVPFTASTPGKKRVSGELKFAVCSATSCDPKKETITLTIDVR